MCYHCKDLGSFKIDTSTWISVLFVCVAFFEAQKRFTSWVERASQQPSNLEKEEGVAGPVMIQASLISLEKSFRSFFCLTGTQQPGLGAGGEQLHCGGLSKYTTIYYLTFLKNANEVF